MSKEWYRPSPTARARRVESQPTVASEALPIAMQRDLIWRAAELAMQRSIVDSDGYEHKLHPATGGYLEKCFARLDAVEANDLDARVTFNDMQPLVVRHLQPGARESAMVAYEVAPVLLALEDIVPEPPTF